MDRKNEFAERVRAVDEAQVRRDGRSLVAASDELSAQVTELRRRLSTGDRAAIDEALDFVELRKPVFRVGYDQEKLFRSLKQAELDDSQLGRLEFLALQLLSSSLQGGQLRELARVLRGRASTGFRTKLQALASATEPVVRRRAVRTLSVVSEGRRVAKRPSSTTKRPRTRRRTTG